MGGGADKSGQKNSKTTETGTATKAHAKYKGRRLQFEK